MSRSSAEAEYRALSTTVCELQWISYLASDLGVQFSLPLPLWCDNKAALHITANPVFHERTKHLDIDCHFVRQKFKDGFIVPMFIPTGSQLADSFTKILTGTHFRTLVSKLGLCDVYQSSPT